MNSVTVHSSPIIRNDDLMWWYDVSKRGGLLSFSSLYDLTGRGQNLTWQSTPPPVNNGYIEFGTLYAGTRALYSDMLDRDIADVTFSVWLRFLYTSGSVVLQPIKLAVDRNDVNNHFKVSFNDGRAVNNFFNSTGANYCALGDAGTSDNLDNPLFDGVWHKYDVVRRGSLTPKWYHYIDGVLSGMTAQEDGAGVNGLLSPSSAGGVVWLEIFSMAGDLGPFYAYKRALTDAQILWNYNVDKNKYI